MDIPLRKTVIGDTHTFNNGFEFIINPNMVDVWTTKGYMSKPEARQLFKSMLAQGLTYKSTKTHLYWQGFEGPCGADPMDNPESTSLDWRDMVMACK